MTKTRMNILWSILLLLVWGFASCDKNEDTTENTTEADLTVTADDEIVANSYDMATKYTDEVETIDLSKKGSVSFQGCATVTKTHDGTTKTLEIDFGTGCTGPYGHTRSGKIIMNITGTRLTDGFVKSITFSNFYLDGNLIEGTRTITTSFNGITLLQHVVIDNGRVTLTDGVVVSYEENKTRTLVEGIATPLDITDDVWEIRGTSEGTAYNQQNYSMTILNAIRRPVSCMYAVSGTKKIVNNNRVAILDYGDGLCDDEATVTIGTISRTITLGERWKE